MSGSRERGRYAALFAEESRTLLAAAVDGLSSLGRALADGGDAALGSAAVDAVFRAVHSLKGMAGAMELASAESLAHELETALARVRDRAFVPNATIVDTLVDAVDALDAAIDASMAGHDADVAPTVDALRALHASSHASIVRRQADVALEALPGTAVAHIRLAPDTPLPGVRAMLVVRQLASLGAVDATRPPFDAMYDEMFDGAFAVRLRTDSSPADIERVARGAGDVADVRVDVPATPRLAADATSVSRATHVRVDRARLDALLDVAGELTIARARLAAATAHVSDPTIAAAVAEVVRLVGTLHEEVRSARTAPASEVFERLPRVVREVARAVGKRAEFVLEGADVALDRAVLEELNDPLVHLLRNAVDHGLESPAEREALGKPPTGRIVLRAARDRDTVIVSVHDDGRGIDRDRVAAHAALSAQIDDAALLSLLARPGFTTAPGVSSVSGRGVGVDAVQDRLRRIGGALELSTTAGQGTSFTMRLPLTLALGRALIARIGDEVYAMPVSNVRETAEIDARAIERVGDREMVRIRDELLPIVRLAEVLGVASAPLAASDGCAAVASLPLEIVVVDAGARRAAVIVDAIDGQQDLVVKRLPPVRGAYRLFGGATILADGTAALVLDLPSLVMPAHAGVHQTLA